MAVYRQGAVGTQGAEPGDRPAARPYERFLYMSNASNPGMLDSPVVSELNPGWAETDGEGDPTDTVCERERRYLQNRMGDVKLTFRGHPAVR